MRKASGSVPELSSPPLGIMSETKKIGNIVPGVKLTEALSDCAEWLYVIDEKTMEIVYANEPTKKSYGENYCGKKCYEYFTGSKTKCRFCPALASSGELYAWEYYDRKTDNCFIVKNKLIEENGVWFRVGNMNSFKNLLSLTRDTVDEIRNLREVLELNEQRKYLLEWNAYHDKMTRLYNRSCFIKDCNEIYHSQTEISVVYFDINNLKITNDTLGHTEGDKLIKTIAAILEGYTSDTVRIYRMGGDEFLTIIRSADADAASRLSETFAAELKSHNARNGTAYSVASGVASGMVGNDIELVLRQADAKMYEQKKKSKEAGEKS